MKPLSLSPITALASLLAAFSASAQTYTPIASPQAAPTPIVWPEHALPDNPFPASPVLTGVIFTGRHVEYTGADTWYPSWASDGNLYSPWTDGSVNGKGCSSMGDNPSTGQATILGDDPLHLRVINESTYPSSPKPYQGRYPAGSLVYNGVWFYGTYCLSGNARINRDGVEYNWPWLGPFVGFRWSTDLGKTWTQTLHTPEKPLFDEHSLHGEPVKIGAPHFVDFGKNMEHSPDGKAYLVAHGASDGENRRFGYNSWITGDEVYLIRVTPSIEAINDPAQYEFFAGNDAEGKPVWSRDFAAIRPIAAWRDRMGCVTMTYNAPLKKYLMCVTDGEITAGFFNSYILESDHITGPFKQVQYLYHFGEQAYFVNIPSKFISADGLTFWLCYAANFAPNWNPSLGIRSNPPGSGYHMCLQEAQLQAPGKPAPSPLANFLHAPENVAKNAVVVASSTHAGYTTKGAVDGEVGGYPDNTAAEWASNGQAEGAEIRLTWSEPQKINRVVLFDRPNNLDQVLLGRLTFSDGTALAVKMLADDAQTGLDIRFPTKTVTWVTFTVDEAKPGTQNVGLSEIGVFQEGEGK